MIDVREYGTQGPLVILLHGGPGAPGYMSGLARLLSEECRVSEPLQRLSGDERLTVARHVADLHELLQTVGEPFHLVGSSWGAMLGLTYAARYPEGIEQVVLIGCGTFDPAAREVYRQLMKSGMSEKDRQRQDWLEHQLDAETDPNRRNLLFAKLCDIGVRTQSYALMTNDIGVIDFDERGHRETWTDVVRLQETGVQPAEFRHIKSPVLMLHGEVDPHPGRLIRESLREVIESFDYREFRQCGHMPWLESAAHQEFLSVLLGGLIEGRNTGD